ncbi:glycoside hydrolase family 3 C-terminal domain-containing protein [Blastococcus sp. URHD0036]|uniref:glycoside hydrolase family 3 C-terminal domain-containing protein n=1 Tax=Blastococcus sp. URHD0036 TaxID=1380356 RepID=UPI000495B6F0|nr:glycoside hydrolase family 3 C-terminal domain-containing protein [Blastococcus sp. URHD0036]
MTSHATGAPAPALDPADLPLELKAALLCGRDFWSTHPVEEAGVPSIVLTDGPHGVRRQRDGFDHLGIAASAPATCFPPAVAVGSSWDPTVAQRIGEAVGREARALGVHVVLGPGVNIKRSPLCGRNFEYYSEDPLLSGVLGAAHVRGQQAQGVGASVKHFAANNQETDRMRISADVDERTLREIYLPAFERVVTEAAPATVMCAYNQVNGVFAAENHWLLTEVLREQWGFDGLVVSDWGAVQDPVASVRAGLDLQMPGSAKGRGAAAIVSAVRAGELDEGLVDAAVARVVRLARTAGEPTDGFDAAAHHALARELAAECAVLLKNDAAVLPLDPGASVAVIGEFARTPRFQGGGSSRVAPTSVDSALDGIQALTAGQVVFAPGFVLEGQEDPGDLLDEAVTAARSADVAVVFAGLRDDQESEGVDRPTLDLPADQVTLIRAVAAAARQTVVVLSHGGVVSLEGWCDDVDAVLDGFLLGQAGGAALADLLFGVVDPSGRLAESIPVRLSDTAAHLNFPGEQGHVRYGEGVMVGYRWYGTAQRPVRYPFGHGLGYTTFATGALTVEATGDDTARAIVTVTNTGRRTGKHVVQVYVATGAGPVRRPVRELRAFAKVEVDPGESRTVSFDLDRRAFAYWDVERDGWVVAPGSYRVQVAQDAATVLAEEALTLAGDDLTQELTLDSTVEEWFTHPVVGPTLLDDLTGGGSDGPPVELPAALLPMIFSMPFRKVVDLLPVEVPEATLSHLMARSRELG